MSAEHVDTTTVDEPLSDDAETLVEAADDGMDHTTITVNTDDGTAVWLTIEAEHGFSADELAVTAALLGEIDYLNVWQTDRHDGFDIELRVTV